MRLLLSAFAASLLISGVSAYADTVYTLENQAGTGSYGTVTINSTSGHRVRHQCDANHRGRGGNLYRCGDFADLQHGFG